MDGWSEGIADAISYIEEHLTDEMCIADIAARAHVSAFYFQKIFSVLCGFTVGEYIRARRLTLAAQELSSTGARVIDVALKYGYDSLDSFARAFAHFHGVSPSAAREKGARLRSVAPLKIKLILEGGNMLEYSIIDKPAFTVVGVARRFSGETSYRDIPAFWAEHTRSAAGRLICGKYGVCIDSDGQTFDYMIADDYDPACPVPEGMAARTLPAGTWAVFPCRGALPGALQDVNTRIWSEWLPSSRAYRLSGNYNIELYTSDMSYSEIWVPVEKA